jgi:hypothetical protein
MGVFPQLKIYFNYFSTVQIYSLDDPAPTYGNKNFSQMLKYLFLEADRRESIYFPETGKFFLI